MGNYARSPRCRAEIALGWQKDFAAAIRTLQDGLAGQLLAKRGGLKETQSHYRWRLLLGSARNLLQSAGRPPHTDEKFLRSRTQGSHQRRSIWWRRRADDDHFRISELRGTEFEA